MEVHEEGNSKIINPCSVMLCGVCDRAISSIRNSKPGSCTGPDPDLFEYPEREDTWRGAHHIEIGSFSHAVTERCYICYTLHEACPREARKHTDTFRTFYEIKPHGDDRYLLQFTIEVMPNGKQSEAVAQVVEPYGTFKILPRTDVPNVGGRLELTPNTFTGKCETQVRDWLNECTAKHSICNEDWRTSFDYPVRLLKVSAEQGEQVYLDSFDRGAQHVRYVTLSHCWNQGRDVELVKLTMENHDDLRCGFSISSLPKKFQDAIIIARWMKVDYLWIDALCIVQNSREDWQRQSSVMGDIYAGSYCNIAATTGDEKKGCFVDRPVEIVEPYFVPDPKRPSTMDTHVIGYDDVWCNSLLDTALHTRAWVLQERLLSPRTIHFGKEQMFWECRLHKACEAYPSGVPPEFSNHRAEAWRHGEQMFNPKSGTMQFGQQSPSVFSRFRISNLLRPTQSSHVIPSEQAYKFWSTTVERYMECNLSDNSDKLVAIAGIANKVKETTGERYLAGMWENKNLPQSLLWYVPVREQADGRPSQRSPSLGEEGYRAPSWSWASLDAKIVCNWPIRCDEILISIDGTHIDPLGDGVGAILFAKMCLRGHLLAAQLHISHSNENGSPKEDGSYTLVPKRTQHSAAGLKFEPTLQPQMEPTIYLDTALSPLPAIDVHLLPICTEWRDRNNRVSAALAGLILRKSRSAKETRYHRIGVFGFDAAQASIVRKFWGYEGDIITDETKTEPIVLI